MIRLKKFLRPFVTLGPDTSLGKTTKSEPTLTSPTCQIADLDRLYRGVFDIESAGSFVEFGGYDGEYVSNTAGLADQKWRGLYIEPVPTYAERCRQRHANNNVTVVESVVGSEPGTCEVHLGGPLSTVSKDALKAFSELEWAKEYHSGETVKAVVRTLDEILQCQDYPVGFEVLSIDVEGFEPEVFKGFSLRRWRPQLLIVELHDQNPDYPKQHLSDLQLSDHIRDAGYRIALKDLSNTVFRYAGPT